VAVVTGGTLVGRAIIVLASPLLSRLYTPADFGMRSVLFSVTTALIIVSALNYEAAIPLPKEDDMGIGVMAAAFALLALTTIFCATIVTFLGALIARLLGSPQLQRYLWLLPVGMGAGGTFFIVNAWAIRVGDFRGLAKRRIAQSIFQVTTQLGVSAFVRGPLGLMLGDCAGRAGGATSLLADSARYLKTRNLRISLENTTRAIVRYKRFPAFGLSSVLVHTSLSLLPPLLLTRLFGLQAAGWFALSYQVLGLTVELVGLGIAQVYLSHTAQLARTSPSAMRHLLFKMTRAMFIVGLGPLGLMALAGPRIFSIVFGSRWLEAGKYGQLLALPFLVMFVASAGLPVLTVLERQHWQLAADSVGVSLLCAGIWYVHRAGLSGRWAVAAYGVALIITYTSFFCLALRAIRDRMRLAATDAEVP
jgi:O-antigen/teichoic acid export membrane protein